MNTGRLGLYINTIKYLRPSQIYYRLRRRAGLETWIGCAAKYNDHVHILKTVPELDFDPVFLSRFNVGELMNDEVCFLHSPAAMDWDEEWFLDSQSTLWNYNLHYFEYLFPLLKADEENPGGLYLDKAVRIIESWIDCNTREKRGIGWDPYTIDLRLTNWLNFFSAAWSVLSDTFKKKFIRSVYEQYDYLSHHLEKDILGNHFFEDLKTLVLCAVFFEDSEMLDRAFTLFLRECEEEILNDGVHFELSPMYHNIVLEGLIRVCTALNEIGYSISELERKVQAMLDAAWSLGESLERIPLFNDSGNNVAKSLAALVSAAANNLRLRPAFKSAFPDAGFYIFRHKEWKLIVDAGQPGPSYIPGHAHCDALSFELFKEGRPVITNCGTFAYQSSRRNDFRRTDAHNTVKLNGREQSQIWGTFRIARRSSVIVIEVDSSHIVMEMKDYAGAVVRRTISLKDSLVITDVSTGSSINGFLHFLREMPVVFDCKSIRKYKGSYAPEYGLIEQVETVSYQGRDIIKAEITLSEQELQ